MKIQVLIDKKGRDIFTIAPDATLADMVEEMVSRHIGSLLVVGDDGQLQGIVTERDFLRNVARYRGDWEGVKVSEVMTRELITTSPVETLDDVMAKMSENRIRHIPVMHENEVAGLLSVVDIIRSLHEESRYQNSLLKRYINDWPEKGDESD